MDWTILATSAVPAVANLAGNLLTSPRQTAYEKKLNQLAEYFGEQAQLPYIQSTEGRSGMQMIERADQENRKRSTSHGIRTGQTDEAKIAGNQSANEAMTGGINRLMWNASRYRNRMHNQQVQMLGLAEQAKQGREAEWQNKIQGITQGLSLGAQGFNQYRMLSKFLGAQNPAQATEEAKPKKED